MTQVIGTIVAANFLTGKKTLLHIEDGGGKRHELYISEAFQVGLPFKLCMQNQFTFSYSEGTQDTVTGVEKA